MLYFANDRHRKQITVDVRNEAGGVILRRQVRERGEEGRQRQGRRERGTEPGGGERAPLLTWATGRDQTESRHVQRLLRVEQVRARDGRLIRRRASAVDALAMPQPLAR